MAAINGIPLNARKSRSGGMVLFLDKPSSTSESVEIQNDIEVRVTADSPAVVVLGLDSASYADTLRQAPESANQALDLLCITKGSRATIADPGSSHLAWWSNQGSSTIRIHSASSLSFSTSATVEVRDASGRVKPAPSFTFPAWHESMRYFRMSQTTTDLYDAFRNVYLALESILSMIEPVRLNSKGKSEGEGEWVERALRTANTRVNLAHYLVAPSVDPVADVKDELYRKIRTSIFHAKNGRPVLIPQDAAHRQTVSDALGRYVRLYLDLATKELGTIFPSSVLTIAGFELMVDSALSSLTIHVSDEAMASDNLEEIAPTGDGAYPLTTSRWRDLDRPLFTTLGGTAAVSDMVKHVTSPRCLIAATPDGVVTQVESLNYDLTLDGFDTFECTLGLEIVNGRAPKTIYPT